MILSFGIFLKCREDKTRMTRMKGWKDGRQMEMRNLKPFMPHHSALH